MKLKEFLSVRAIEFESINVLEGTEGLAELRRLGARSVPILSRGDQWVFAQNIAHVVKFLGLNEAAGPIHGATLTYESLAVSPGEELHTFGDIAAFGETVRQNLNAWWAAKTDKAGRETVQTYYGPQLLHETLERATWHSGQHVRQWFMLLGMAGIPVESPLTEADFNDLPMPSSVWDG